MAAKVQGFALLVRTLGGSSIELTGLDDSSTVETLQVMLAERLEAPPFCIKLVGPAGALEEPSCPIADMALQPEAITVIRVAATREGCRELLQALLQAIGSGNAAEARRIVNLGGGLDEEGEPMEVDVRSHDRFDKNILRHAPGLKPASVLNLAVRANLKDLALHLISKDVALEQGSEAGRTPLAQAVIKGQEEVVAALINKGVCLEVCDDTGKRPLDYAVFTRPSDRMAMMLLEAGAKYDCLQLPVQRTESGQPLAAPHVQRTEYIPPVLAVLRQGLAKTAMALLEKGAKWQGADDCGRTALHYAYNLDCDRDEVVKALMERGADARALDSYGHVPCYYEEAALFSFVLPTVRARVSAALCSILRFR